MNPQKVNKFKALIPALWASGLDIFVTIFLQNPGYWKGDLTLANEANPIGGTAMAMHVSGIFIVCGVWLIIIPLLGYYLPKRWSKIFLLFVVIAHSIGASSWLTKYYGFWWLVILSAFNAILYLYFNNELKQRAAKETPQNL